MSSDGLHSVHHLRADGVSMVVDARGGGVPSIVHWGADVGELSNASLLALADGSSPAIPNSSIDVPFRLTLLPCLADGWSGRPALRLSRERAIDPALELRTTSAAGGTLSFDLVDVANGFEVRSEMELSVEGVLRIRHSVTNTVDAGLRVGAVSAVVPVPDRARELLDFAGGWSHERRPQRLSPGFGAWVRDGRHGRPGHDAPYLLSAGTPGFGFRTGEIWAAHLAWSGDGAVWFERSPLGFSAIGGGEHLSDGEVALGVGETYVGQWLVLSTAQAGLDQISDRLHRWIRSWSTIAAPRPVVLNTWEAVYFEHSLERLTPLVETAAHVGVERFVLDDGWFRGRVDDHRALGDWFVDSAKWPEGLGPLVELVTARGMDFGLWVEPEMVSRDSDVAREHPEWILQPTTTPTWRSQNTLDLANPEAFGYIFDRLDALLSEYPIAYLKWDHNRDLLVSDAHRQTSALYALIDAVRAAHPSVEIESCASGGGRIDLGILSRVDRVWPSDTNDPLERQRIQRFSSLLVPPEYLGSHLGAAEAHTTGRVSSLTFRLITAFFGSAGIEWDITRASDDELKQVAAWVNAYKDNRALLHSGTVVRMDDPAEPLLAHGVVSRDRARALFGVALLDTLPVGVPPRLRFAGLDPDRSYQVRPVTFSSEIISSIHDARPSGWWSSGQLTLSGRALMESGIAIPRIPVENAILLSVQAS